MSARRFLKSQTPSVASKFYIKNGTHFRFSNLGGELGKVQKLSWQQKNTLAEARGRSCVNFIRNALGWRGGGIEEFHTTRSVPPRRKVRVATLNAQRSACGVIATAGRGKAKLLAKHFAARGVAGTVEPPPFTEKYLPEAGSGPVLVSGKEVRAAFHQLHMKAASGRDNVTT